MTSENNELQNGNQHAQWRRGRSVRAAANHSHVDKATSDMMDCSLASVAAQCGM